MIFDTFIRRPRLALVISVLITMLGTISWFILPSSQYPSIAPPRVTVTAIYPGASARVVEQSIAQIIEAEVNGTPGMIYMKSTSNDGGLYVLAVSFEIGTDVDLAAVDIANRVAIAEPSLPSSARQLGVSVKKSNPDTVFTAAFTSNDPAINDLYLHNFLNLNVLDEVNRLAGVGEASIMGGAAYAMRIWIEDPIQLAGVGLSENDIMAAIRAQNVIGPAGTIGALPLDNRDQALQLTVLTPQLMGSVEEFEAIILKSDAGGIVRLGDVARIEISSENSVYAELDGQPTAALNVKLAPGANAVNTVAAVRDLLETLRPRFPEGVDFTVITDNAAFVQVMIDKVVSTFVEALILVTLVVFLFLGSVRATIIPLIAVPVSVVGTFAVLMAFGFSANTISLLALVLAIGIVVDNAIIVVENVERVMHEEPDLSPAQATSKAMGQIVAPVVGTTLVLLAVFVPVAVLPGSSGVLFREFAVTISAAMIISMINALTLSPALCAMLMRNAPVPRIMQRISAGIDAVSRGYGNLVRRIMAASAISVLAAGAFAWFSYATLSTIPSGFVPDEDKGSLIVAYLLPEGAAAPRTSEVGSQAYEIVKADPAVQNVVRIDGVDIISAGLAPNAGAFIVKLKEYSEREEEELTLKATAARLQGLLAGALTEANAIVLAPPTISGIGSAGGFEYMLLALLGQTPQEISALSRTVAGSAQAEESIASIFTGFSASTPQIMLNVNRTQMAELGVSLPTVYSTLQTRFAGTYVNDFSYLGRNWQVKVQGDSAIRDGIEDLEQTLIPTATGQLVPVEAFAETDLTAGPRTLVRYNNYSAVGFNGNPALGFGLGSSMDAMERLSEEVLPQGYDYSWTGLALQQKQAAGQTAIVIGLAFVFAYLFLVGLYESSTIPAAVLLSVVVSVLAAILALKATGLSFDLYGQIGIVVLVALSAKNAIIMFSFCLDERKVGKPLLEATMAGARLRFRPIMMTSLAFVAGLVPLVLSTGPGSGAMLSVGVPVLAGMVAASTVGMVMIPMLFYFVQGLRERMGWTPGEIDL